MRANIKFTAIYILVLVLLTLSLVAVISYSQDVTYAQNTDVQIDLSEDSLFDSYGEVFAYTYGYSLYLVVDNNIINLTSAFEGTAIDIAMNGSKILVLTSSALYEYSYTTSSITSNGAVTRFSGTIIGLFNDSYDGLGVIMNTNTATYMQDYSAQTTYVTWPLSDVYSDYLSVISSNVMFALKDGVLYRSPIEGIDASFTAISSLSNVYSITSDGTNIYALTESGVYKINALTLSTSFLGEIFSTSVKIKVVEIEESEYIFAFGNKSIVQYLINGSSLEYYNKFDNSSYVHPTSFDIVKVVMLNENVNVYSSPRNMQVTTTLSTGDLVLVLCEQASDVSSDVYYYIATTSGTLGYIKSTTSCTETDKTTDTTTLSIGLYAQGLHASTTIYAYPYIEISIGIGYNKQKVEQVMGKDFKFESWNDLFNPENSAKLKKCGIAIIDSPIEVISAVQHYLNKPPRSEKAEDYEEARKILTSLASNTAYFQSNRYVTDIASGEICVAIGYSGDFIQARHLAQHGKHKYDVDYVIPKEGSIMWFDSWTVPRGAKNVDNAMTWFNWLLDPKNASALSDEIGYIMPVDEAMQNLSEELRANPSIMLSDEKLKTMYFMQETSQKTSKIVSNVWNTMKMDSEKSRGGQDNANGWD